MTTTVKEAGEPIPVAEAQTLASLLRTLGDPTRLRILTSLETVCVPVSAIVGATGLRQPTVSHHLRILRDRGLVRGERRGGYVFYCLTADGLLREALESLRRMTDGVQPARSPSSDRRTTMTTGHDVRDAQRAHWQTTFRDNPEMYGTEPSGPGAYAVDLFTRADARDVLELGAGQGRDTQAFLRARMSVTALDYSPDALTDLENAAAAAGTARRLTTLAHDVRKPLPLPDASVDAVYSHMLFNMALTTPELHALTAEVHRVLRPGGLHVYTVRHVGDAHYGAGTDHGDDMFENGGFIVHFFDRTLVDRLATGFTLLDLTAFEEGGLPRRLWRVTLRRDGSE